MGVAVALAGLLMQAGQPWRPATEWFLRLGQNADSVGAAWWIAPAAEKIEGKDAPEFIVNVAIAPGTYGARLRSAATHRIDTARNQIAVPVNGRPTIR
jgi:hypothetical protein